MDVYPNCYVRSVTVPVVGLALRQNPAGFSKPVSFLSLIALVYDWNNDWSMIDYCFGRTNLCP